MGEDGETAAVAGDRPSSAPRGRVLALALAGLLVLAAIVAIDLGRSGEAKQREAPPEPPVDRTAELLGDAERWAAATPAERRAAAERVGERTAGFALDRIETFSGGGQTNEIAVYVHARTGLEFSLVPAGTFWMGSPEDEGGRFDGEGPLRRVTLARPFLVARTECTQAAWDLVGGEDDRFRRGSKRPIERVTWTRARNWCTKAGLRLPTESEWEYACRAGTTTRFWSGDDEDDLDRVGWYSRGPGHRTRHVGEKPPNAFGLHDMHGSVFEWCQDTGHATYDGAPNDGSAWVDDGSENRVIRGGSFATSARTARSAYRLRLIPRYRADDLGFRPASSVTTD